MIIGVFLLLSVFIVCIFAYSMFKQFLFVNKYKQYEDLVNSKLNTCYDTIYRQYILTFSADGYTMSQDQHETVQREFIKLFYSITGKKSIKMIIKNHYGSEDVLLSYAILFYQDRRSTDTVMNAVKMQETE